jgi:hypothetical protein
MKKDKLCTTPVLSYPNFKLTFILTCVASKLAVGAVLSQVPDGAERSIAYASRQLNTAEQSYSSTEPGITCPSMGHKVLPLLSIRPTICGQDRSLRSVLPTKFC